MSIYKDEKHGTWYCKFRFTDWQGNKKETTKRGFKTKREAKEYEENFKREIIANPQITMSQLIEDFLKTKEAKARESSVIMYRSIIKTHILPYLKQLPITDITPSVINRWQQKIVEKNLSDYYTFTINNVMAMIMNHAVAYYNLEKNPFKNIKKLGSKRVREEVWTVDDFNKAISRVGEARFFNKSKVELTLKLLFFSGMRYGELIALKKDDFDFSSNTIDIYKSYSSNSRKIGKPKTQKGFRKISMPEKIMQDVQEYFEKLYAVEEYPFKTKSNSLTRQLSILADMAGVTHITAHGLRHSHATFLIAQGIPIPNIAKRLGDTSETVMNVYAHALNSVDNDISEKLNDFVGQTVVKNE